jgi:ribonuclease BN (tRNA processing enzyme)
MTTIHLNSKQHEYTINNHTLRFTPLGAGQEVGRSCFILEYKGHTIMLDCGVHPAKDHGEPCLPLIDKVKVSEIELLCITHYHIDHCAALPYLLNEREYKGKILMTPPSKSIFEELFEQYIEDENGDGEISVDVYYIPASEEAAIQSGYTGDSTKLFAEFQVGQSLLVISDTDADAFIVPDSTLDDLEPKLGMYEQTEGFRFYLHDTDFAEAVGWEEPLDEDIYIGIRKVKDSFSFKEEMQKNYEIAFPALQKFAEEFGTVAE